MTLSMPFESIIGKMREEIYEEHVYKTETTQASMLNPKV